ncbi:ABC-type uncharacterized transport system [uncultured archaeon]|nr:ABC-type uncharacterized transport system [uncultured archaeon]
MSLSFLTLIYTNRPELWIASLTIFICGFDLLLRSAGVHEEKLPALALGSSFYAIFYIFYLNVPFIWESIISISHELSAFLGRIAGIPITFGPTISSLLILLTFFCYAVSFFIFSEKRLFLRALIAILTGLTLTYAAYFLITIQSWATADKFMDRTYLVFLVLIIPFLIFSWRIRVKSADLGSWIPSFAQMGILAALLFTIILISIFPYFYNGELGKAVIYERDSEMGFEIPHFPQANQSFAPDDGFSVGAIKLYLQNIGGTVEELNSTNPHNLEDALKDARILVLMNLKKAFSYTEQESIKEFVKNGGGLLVFGEHTSMFAQDQDFAVGRDYLNDVLAPTGIRINPDTADYIPEHWQYAASALPHMVTRDLGFEITTSSVGASLNISGKARPLIIGRYAYSDKSNLTAPGHLGDRFYERDETLGDLVIAACDTYGKGKVLVFGDTSYAFNSELPLRYNLIYNSFAWLRSREADYAAGLSWVSFFLLFAIAAYILVFCNVIGKNRPKITLLFLTMVAIVLVVSLIFSASINGAMAAAPQESKAIVAWIDHTHLNQFNLENYQDDGIAGLTINLFRNGFLPQLQDSEDGIPDIRKGAVSIIIAPNRHYTSKDATKYTEFVESGGLLIISAGHKSAIPLDSILRAFDLQISDLPLGSPPWIIETHATNGEAIVSQGNLKKYWHKPKFMEAYPVMAKGDYKPLAWMRYNGETYNLILQKEVGQGSVILIGDSRFLLNENLEYLSEGEGRETREQYQLQWLGNIELLRKILTGQNVGRV